MELLVFLKTYEWVGYLLLGILLPWLINQREWIAKVVLSMVQWILKINRVEESSVDFFKVVEYMHRLDKLLDDTAAQYRYTGKKLDILERRLTNLLKQFPKNGCDCAKFAKKENIVLQAQLQILSQKLRLYMLCLNLNSKASFSHY